MKLPTFILFTALAVAGFADEEIAEQEEIALNDPVAMGKLAKVFGRTSPTERVQTLESQMKQVYTDTVRGQFGAKPASARPQIDSYGFFTEIGPILWKAYEGGDDYAFTDHTGSSATPSIGANKHTNFHWNWGARALLGYRFGHDTWDFLARYTWLKLHASSKVGLPAGGAVEPLHAPYQAHSSTLAESSWGTKYTVFEFELAKSFFLNRWFAATPFIGLRNGWINQKMHDSYSNYPTTGTTTLIRNRNDFWGLGPWSGVNTTMFFGKMFNLFSSVGGALMISNIKTHVREIQNVTDIIDLNAKVTRIVPMLQASLGLGWEMSFKYSRVGLQFAYEAQYWWRQNQMLHFGASGPAPFRRISEDLGLHGVTLDLLFDF